MKYIIASCLCSIIVSVVINRIIAIHYMRVIDSYMEDMIKMLKNSIRTTDFQK